MATLRARTTAWVMLVKAQEVLEIDDAEFAQWLVDVAFGIAPEIFGDSADDEIGEVDHDTVQ